MGVIRFVTNGLPAVMAHTRVAARTGLEIVGDGIAQSARRRVPVDTGALLESIEARVVESADGAIVRVAVSAGTEPGQPITTGSGKVVDVDYPAHVEFGTSRQPAQPFLTPAVEEWEGEVATILANEVERKWSRGGR